MNDELRKLQLVDLELFRKFSCFCKKNNIKYFVLGGTLLGAVRHKGFIPWDDDMDLGIPREDYEKLLFLCKKEKINFKLHTFENDENHYRYFARLEDSSIKIKRSDKSMTEISSAWVDIFPLDGMPNNFILRAGWKYYILYRRAIYRLSCFDKAVNVNKKGRPLIEKILIKLGKIIPTQKLFNTKKELIKLDKALKKFPYSKSNYLVNAMGAYKFNEMFHKKIYGNGKWYEFEDIKVWGPEDYDTVCRQLYGEYMTLPKDENKNHHISQVLQ